MLRNLKVEINEESAVAFKEINNILCYLSFFREFPEYRNWAAM